MPLIEKIDLSSHHFHQVHQAICHLIDHKKRQNIQIPQMSLTNATPVEAARSAKSASHLLATLPVQARNDALTAIHAALVEAKDDILAANARDMDLARKAAADGELGQSLVSRLDLAKKGKWEDMLKGILDVRGLDDPGESEPEPPSRHFPQKTTLTVYAAV